MSFCGKAELLVLPEIGIGNSRMLMQDDNSLDMLLDRIGQHVAAVP